MSLRATAVSAAAFLPGDAVKAVIAALVAKAVHAAYPALGEERARSRAGTT